MKLKSNTRRLQLVNAVLVFVLLCVSASLRLAFPENARAQVRPVNDYGALGLGRLLKRINTTASVMMIGAHPDDEDSSLLAYLARGENARTAYLSLTRGDGGQNIIGPELFESLGVIRTEELLQARRLDGAEQYFTRAFDYGFSKTLAEARQKWDEKVIVCDTVRAIRTFRPLVVISRFSGTSSDGHGQHQYSGYITPIAVKAAADPKQCTDAGTAWQVQKFYREIGGQPTLRLNTGTFDPMLGRSYAEIAIEGRSLHRSQGEGRIEPRGEQFSNLTLIESTVPKVANETSIFDGIDTTLAGISKTYHNDGDPVSEYTNRQLAVAEKSAEQALKEFDFRDPSKSISALVNGYDTLNLLNISYIWFSGTDERREQFSKRAKNEAEIQNAVSIQAGLFNQAIMKAIGLQIDALADAEIIVPGESLSVTTRVYLPKNPKVTIKKIEIQKPNNWTVNLLAEPTDSNAGGQTRRDTANASARFKIDVPRDATVTQPYWLTEPRDGDLFRWSQSDAHMRPFDFSQLSASVIVEINGKEAAFTQPLQYRYADPSRGEIRREINLVPALSVGVDHDLLIVPQSDKPQTRKLSMSVTDNSAKPISGFPGVNIPTVPEWKYTFDSQAVELKTKGEKTSISFDEIGRAHV